MKQKFKIFALACLAFPLMVACSSDSKDAFRNNSWYSLDEGIKIAGEMEKKVLLYFRADWWQYCRKLDKVLAQPNILAYLNEHFISVMVDYDREKEIVRKYHVRGIPDIRFLDSRGEELRRITGFVPEDTFLSMLKYMNEDAFRDISFNEFLRLKWCLLSITHPKECE